MKNEKKINSPNTNISATPVSKTVPVTKPGSAITPKTKVVTTATHMSTKNIKADLFGKENYKWMLIGLVVMAIGFFLMAGGKSSNPNVFTDEEVYSTTRITIAPMLIIAGLIIEIFAIMRKSKTA